MVNVKLNGNDHRDEEEEVLNECMFCWWPMQVAININIDMKIDIDIGLHCFALQHHFGLLSIANAHIL